MPIRSYFSPRRPELRMPRSEAGQPDSHGITWHGDLTTGKLSVQEAFRLEGSRLAQSHPGPTYLSPSHYDDPVLRYHTRQAPPTPEE